MANKFDEMGVSYVKELALTGVNGSVFFGGGIGPRVSLTGEMDSLVVSDHTDADTETGAAHA